MRPWNALVEPLVVVILAREGRPSRWRARRPRQTAQVAVAAFRRWTAVTGFLGWAGPCGRGTTGSTALRGEHHRCVERDDDDKGGPASGDAPDITMIGEGVVLRVYRTL